MLTTEKLLGFTFFLVLSFDHAIDEVYVSNKHHVSNDLLVGVGDMDIDLQIGIRISRYGSKHKQSCCSGRRYRFSGKS